MLKLHRSLTNKDELQSMDLCVRQRRGAIKTLLILKYISITHFFYVWELTNYYYFCQIYEMDPSLGISLFCQKILKHVILPFLDLNFSVW